MIRLKDITLPFDHKEEALASSILERLGIPEHQLLNFTIVLKSIDARRKNHIVAVYTIDVGLKNEADLLSRFSQDIRISAGPCMNYQLPTVGNIDGASPVVVGSGPCGLFVALILAQLGFKPVLIERGKEVSSRVKDVQNFWRNGQLDPESNVQFGEGGAGTFSDGKLTTQIKDKYNRLRKVLEEFVKAGAPEEILYQSKPHIGTDNLVKIVKNLRNTIISLGGQVRFETKLTGLKIKDGKVAGAIVNDSETIETDTIVLAPGHSARDTFEMLAGLNIPIEAKPFSIGVRIEHPQSLIDKGQYGGFASHRLLGAAEYKLVQHCENGRSAYTFCMCPGGEVIACSSEAGGVVTNGMSLYSRNGPNANSALLVGIGPRDFGSTRPLAGIEFQRKWERKAFETGGNNYFAPVQLVGDFLAGRSSNSLGHVIPSYTPGTTLCDLAECLPGFVAETLRLAISQMDKQLNGFAMNDAVMTAVESRSSSPIRIIRDETFQSPAIKGLYPAGEGAGYAGGIISTAVDGIKIAEAISGKTLKSA
ncbi:MAG TPA: FAD-dependent oxidoreductase [Sedimentisphaerales bacterium]|nr:FAD-dependent oxidoreductase [Sedimentisphaerales bacterium]